MLLSESQDCIVETGKGSHIHMERGILIGFVREIYSLNNSVQNYDVALVVLNGGRLKKADIESIIIIPEEED